LLSYEFISLVDVFIGHLSASEERMTVAQEELQDLKGVWAELSKIWQQIDELKERPWISVQPRKVKHVLWTHVCWRCNVVDWTTR
jgi:hypothetical protein